MKKFTAGPWSVPHFANDESGCSCAYVFSESQRGFGSVATVSFGGEDEDYETAKANAKLIAAAPDLLEALQLITEHVNRYIYGDEDVIVMTCREAIAKALTPQS